MTVLVKNESTEDYLLRGGGSFDKNIEPGMIQMLSDLEWNAVSYEWRGPGFLNPQPLPIASVVPVPPVPPIAYTTRVDATGVDGITYIGSALPGSAGSGATWLIKRLTETAVGPDTTDFIEFANGSADFDQVWDDRASLIYS